MLNSPLLFVYLAVFIGVLLLVEGCYYLLVDSRGAERRIVNRRLRLLASGLDGAEVAARLRRKPLGESGGLLEFPYVVQVDRLLSRAALPITTLRFLGWQGAAFGLAVLVLYLALEFSLLVAVVVSASLVVMVPFFVVSHIARKRARKLEEQLPDAIDMLVRSLRAGHPISSAVGLVGREMPDPIGSEFGLVHDEMTYGLDVREALENMAAKVALPDISFVTVAIKMQSISGGNLAQILGGLARLIRERQRMHLKIFALSAEGRFSVKILGALPFLMFAAISVLNPKYYSAVRTDPTLMLIMSVALVALLVGIAMMRRIVNFRV